MNIIIPMAGMGKRMRPHTLTTPKPLIPIAGKPMVQRIVEDIIATANEPVEEVVFVINPAFGKDVEQHLVKVAESLGAKGKIAYQEQPLGTAHAIIAAGDSLKGPVFIAFADTLFKADFKIDTSREAIIWTQHVEDPSGFGVVKLGEGNVIEAFVEKPKEFVSDLAIIGVYYFKDGERLRKELQRLLDEDIKDKGEYQLTDAMDHMLKSGVRFYTDQVDEWLDCGNYGATVYTAGRIMAIKQEAGDSFHAASATVENSVIIQPCHLGENVVVRNSVVGPNVSLEAGAMVENARVSDTIVGEHSVIRNTVITSSLIGKYVNYSEKPRELSLGDFSTQS
jgi:glucose-1-phosphate thymidylyltransferase